MKTRSGRALYGLAVLATGMLGGPTVCLGATPGELFQQAGAAEIGGKASEARRLWREFLAAQPEGEQVEMVRHQLVPLEAKDLGRNCRHYPVWSPDGRFLMYGYGGPAILDLATGQGVSLEVPTGPLYNHDWSADGVTICGRQPDTAGRQSIFLFERQPDEALFPYGDGLPICEGASARFDASGTKLLISAAAKDFNGHRTPLGIVMFDLATQQLRSIPWQHPERPARNQASWMGTDGYVFHGYGPNAMADRAIFAAQLGDGVVVAQLTDDGADYRTPVVAPDGQRLAYSRCQAGQAETLFLALTDGSIPPISLGPGRGPCWSPDGNWLAYDGPQGIKLLRMGGLSAGPLVATGVRHGDAIGLAVTNDGDVPQEFHLTCQVYDARSVRVADWSWPDASQTVPAGQSLALDYPIPAELQQSAVRARFRLVPVAGPVQVVFVELKPGAP